MNPEKSKQGKEKPRVGLAVVFAALGAAEEESVKLAWTAACSSMKHWQPAFSTYGIGTLSTSPADVDILVYLGESSRFEPVAGELSKQTPVVFVKSTVEELLEIPKGAARRYRMSTGVKGIASALAEAAPKAPTVDWSTLPWPESLLPMTHLDEAEGRYVNISLEAFRTTAAQRGIAWVKGLPVDNQPFSVFLTMHDPAAAYLAEAALNLWPQCTVLAADGMVSTSAPSGQAWPDRLVRVRHWSPQVESASNDHFRQALSSDMLPDFDSPGMTFGTLNYLDHAFAAGASPHNLESVGSQPGPVGQISMTASGKCKPERIILFKGAVMQVTEILG